MTNSNSTATPAAPVDKRGERVQAMFAAIAPRYDLLNRLLSLRIDQRWRRRVVEALPPDDSGLPILDVCTGTGDLALMYARRWPSAAVVGVDFCAPMLERAVAKAVRQKADVQFQQADAMSMPFPDGAFQLATIAFGLRNVADTDAGLRELKRVIAPGGRIAVLEFSTPTSPLLRRMYLTYFQRVLPWIGQKIAPNRDSAYHYLPASVLEFPDGESLARMMEAAGFVDVEIQPFTFGVATLYLGRAPVIEPLRSAADSSPDTV